MIQTVPETPGIRFTLDGRSFVSNSDGLAFTSVSTPGSHKLKVVTSNVKIDDRQLTFSLWSDGKRGRARAIEVDSFTFLEAGFDEARLHSFEFVDEQRTEIKVPTVDSFTITSDDGLTRTMRGSGFYMLPARRVVSEDERLSLKRLTYRVDELMVDGAAVSVQPDTVEPAFRKTTIFMIRSALIARQPDDSSRGSSVTLVIVAIIVVVSLMGGGLLLFIHRHKVSVIGRTMRAYTPRADRSYWQPLHFGAGDIDSRSPDLLDIIFVSSAFLAPLDLQFFKSFTVFDLSIVVLAFLIVAGPVRMRATPTIFGPAAFIFILAALVSVYRATLPIEALTQTLQYAFIFFVLLPVTVTVVRSEFVLRSALVAFIVGTLVGMATALIFQQPSGGGRLQAFFSDNAGRLGQPTAYLLPFVLFFVMDWWRKDRKVTALVAACISLYLMVWALAASGSRAGAVGTVAALLIFVVIRGVTERPPRIWRPVAMAVVMIGVLAFLLYGTDYFPTTLSERVTRTFNPGDELADDRVELNLAGLRAFEDSPLIGTGLDNFQYVARRYGALSDQAPHNVWVQFLAQVGLAGTAMILVIIGAWFLLVFRAHRAYSKQTNRDLLWAFFASGAAIVTIYQTAPVVVHRHYWLLLGLGLTLSVRLSRRAN